MNEALQLIIIAYRQALKKHPGWPTDRIHAAAILGEEAGETLQAAIDRVYFGGADERILEEAAQAGAMAIRVIEGILKSGG